MPSRGTDLDPRRNIRHVYRVKKASRHTQYVKPGRDLGDTCCCEFVEEGGGQERGQGHDQLMTDMSEMSYQMNSDIGWLPIID